VLALAACLGGATAKADDWWGPDKALHLGVSAAIAGVGYGAAAFLSEGHVDRTAAGLLAGLGAGVLKEVLDALGTGTPSLRDLTWDLVGAVAGAALALVLDRWIISPLLEAAAPRFAG
jgi:uncharacterized protein YfiM (DUF2279 family)